VNGWENFFIAEIAASAPLAGLVFVGVSLNLERIMANPVYGLPGRALETLVMLLAVLVISTLMLVPEQTLDAIGAEVLGVGLLNWIAVVVIQLLQLKNLRRLAPEFRWHFVGRVVLGQAATLPFVIAGIVVLTNGVDGLYWIVPGFIFSYVVAFANSWVLLLEIRR
jgi:hypothetical protein